jgi:YHS domain-containing protein
MIMRQHIKDIFITVAILTAAFTLASCGEKTMDEEVPQEILTTDIDYCIYSDLGAEVTEIIRERFLGEQVSCASAKVVFVNDEDLEVEDIRYAYLSGIAVVVVSPEAATLTPVIKSWNAGAVSAGTIDGCLFVAIHKSGSTYSMAESSTNGMNGLVNYLTSIPVSLENSASGEELLQAAHYYWADEAHIKGTTVLKRKPKYSYVMKGQAYMEFFCSVIPLYAFKSSKSNYAGDFYIVDATFSVDSRDMYSGVKKVYWVTDKWHDTVSGFYLAGYDLVVTLLDSNGNEVAATFTQGPSPTTTIGSTTYTSGVDWSFQSALSGGTTGGNLTAAGGCSYNSEEKRTIEDITIQDQSTGTGKLTYVIDINNLPKKPTEPPLISSSTMDFHFSWVWQIDNTKEFDTTTGFKMKVAYKHLTYHVTTSNSSDQVYWDWATHGTTTLDLPIPNRVPAGKVRLENSEDEFMYKVKFRGAESSKNTYEDLSGSVYSKGQAYEISLPEGKYYVEYMVGEKSGKTTVFEVERGEALTLSSGAYIY